jgi:hypothetical protein
MFIVLASFNAILFDFIQGGLFHLVDQAAGGSLLGFEAVKGSSVVELAWLHCEV